MKLKFTPWQESYICGAVTRTEGLRLAHLAATVHEGCIVELGTHSGSSAAWMAMGMQTAGNHHPLYCVDLWDLPVGERLDRHAEVAVLRMFEARIEFMASAGYIDPNDVHPIKGDSQAVAEDWSEPVGLLHVDALHTYEAVTADIEAWVPHVVSGGHVVLHDYSDPKMGVRRAGKELAARPEWNVVGTYDGDRRKRKHGQMVLRRS